MPDRAQIPCDSRLIGAETMLKICAALCGGFWLPVQKREPVCGRQVGIRLQKKPGDPQKLKLYLNLCIFGSTPCQEPASV